MVERGTTEEILRARAVQVDEIESQQIDLALVWRDLVNGESRAADSFHSADRCYLLLEPIGESKAMSKARAGKIRILESILLEGAQKNVAIDLGLSPSTVAGALKKCLASIGLPCSTSRISPLLVGAAYAAQTNGVRRWARLSQLVGSDFSYRVVSVARPEAELAGLLTPAQYDVVRLLIEGKSHLEIASSRDRSARTIANQLGAAFRKLGVSGRSELIRRLITEPAGAEPQASPVSTRRAKSTWAGEPPVTVRRYRQRAARERPGEPVDARLA